MKCLHELVVVKLQEPHHDVLTVAANQTMSLGQLKTTERKWNITDKATLSIFYGQQILTLYSHIFALSEEKNKKCN